MFSSILELTMPDKDCIEHLDSFQENFGFFIFKKSDFVIKNPDFVKKSKVWGFKSMGYG